MLDTTTPAHTPAQQGARVPMRDRRRGQIDRENGQVALSGAGKPDATYKIDELADDTVVFLALHGLRSVLQAGKDEIATFQRLRDGKFAPEHTRGRPRTSLWKEAAAQVLAHEEGISIEAARERVRSMSGGQLTQLRQIARVAEVHAHLSGRAPASVSQLLSAA